MRKFVFLIFFLVLFLQFPLTGLAAQTVVNTNQQGGSTVSSAGPRLETGSVNPMNGGAGLYTFQTFLVNPSGKGPDYVRIFLMKGGSKTEFQGYEMTKGSTSSQGIAYQYARNFEEKDIGSYEFYFEAKFGDKKIHGPSYGGENCQPGLCAACCGAWGGPKIISVNLINENKIYLFQKDKEKPIWSFDAGKNWVTSVAFSPDEKNFAAVDNNQNLYFFDLLSNKPKWTFTGSAQEGGETGMDKGLTAFSKNGYLAASSKGVVYLFKSDSNKPIWSYPTGMVLNGLVISEDGKYLAAAGRDTNVYLWQTENSKPLWVHKIEAKGGLLGGSVIISMAMTSDGKYFVAGTSCPDRSVHVFTPAKPEEIFTVKAGLNFPVGSVSISDDGQYVLAGGGGDPEDAYTAILYKVGNNTPIWNFDASRNPVSEVAISPDGKSCVIGSNMDGLFFMPCSTKKPVWQLKDAGYIAGVTFSKDGKLIAAGSGTNHVFLLPTDGSKILKDWKVENKVESVTMSANGTYIAVGTGLNRFFASSAEGINSSGAGGGEVKEATPQLVKAQNNVVSNGYEQSSGGKGTSLLSSLINRFVDFINSIIGGVKKDQQVISVPQKGESPSTSSGVSSGQYQEGAGNTCGNNVCEGVAGETKESCPKDCSGNN